MIQNDQVYGIVRGDDWIVPGDGASVSFVSITGTDKAENIVRSDSQLNPALEAPFADPDDDGIPNILEVGFVGDPESPSFDILPQISVIEIDGTQVAQIRYRRIKASPPTNGSGKTGVNYMVAGLRYSVEISGDLHVWKSAEEVLDEVSLPIDNGDGSETVVLGIVAFTEMDRSVFVRVRVEIVEK